jgi:transcriptional regulator with XRE-family HTH domain
MTLLYPQTDTASSADVYPSPDWNIRENSRVEPERLRAVLAANVRRAMEENQAIKTQPLLEQRSGLSQSTVSRILNEEGAATIDSIAKLANAAGRQPWELLVDEDATRQEALARMLGRR